MIFVNKYIMLFFPMFLIYCLVEEINIFYLFIYYFILYTIYHIYQKRYTATASETFFCYFSSYIFHAKVPSGLLELSISNY